MSKAAARVPPAGDSRSEGEDDQALIESAVAVNSAPELDEALRLLALTARDLLEADLVTLVVWDEDLRRGVVRAGAGDGASLVGEEVPGSSTPYLAATTGEPVVERSSKTEGVSWAIAKAVRRLATRVTVPLHVEGVPVLTFQAAWRTRRAEATVDRSVRALRTLGALTGVAYRAEEERRRARDRARLETVLESVGDGFWLITGDSVVVNTAARRLLALPDGVAPDFDAFNLRTLDGQPLDIGLVTDVVRSTRLAQHFLVRATRLDGVERIFEGTTSPIVAGGGDLTGTVSVFRDVTERHERELLTERFLERLFDAMPTGVSVLHPTTRKMLTSNRAFSKLVGYERAEMEGIEPPFPWWTSTPDEFDDDEWAPPDGTRRVEALFRRKDGELLPVEILRFWIRDLDGTPLAAVGLITDLSERRRFEQQLLVSGKLATIGELAAGVAHEINNPLFAILGLVEFLLKETEPGTKTHHRLELVQETGLEIKAIVRALLDFARERSDEQAVVSLREVLAQTVELLRRTSAAKQVEIVERYCAEETLVHASASQLKQVLVNLVANAQQAMPGGGTVEIELARDGNWVQASVRDNGPGIPEDFLPRIFEPFFTTKRSVGGTGLGLPVSLGIAQMHGGELLARSTPGEGATFVLRLPAYREAVK